MKTRITIAVCVSFIVILSGVAFGSVTIPPGDVLSIICHKAGGVPLPGHIESSSVAIVWNLRTPRVLLAFFVGAALSVAGSVMQSVLRNPLASPYTLGVSSGASLGAAIVILYGITIPFIKIFTLPLLGFAFGLGTIVLAVAVASRLDGQMENVTIILTGMVFALFINAVTMLMSALSSENLHLLVLWQMGSFSMKDWQAVFIVAPAALAGTLFVSHFNRELDIMTFGEEQARTMGVDLRRVKWILLITSAALTGSAVAFAGIIGFLDLVAPHVVRRLFGSSHRYVVPMAAVIGGGFMIICDLVARTIVSPSELPVGAVTAIIGAPFFAYIYFGGRKKAKRGGKGC